MNDEDDDRARQLDNELNFGGPHRHCFNCYSFTLCHQRDGKNHMNSEEESCDFTKCHFKCGSIFHGCKLDEHLEICPNVTVPCLNQQLGI